MTLTFIPKTSFLFFPPFQPLSLLWTFFLSSQQTAFVQTFLPHLWHRPWNFDFNFSLLVLESFWLYCCLGTYLSFVLFYHYSGTALGIAIGECYINIFIARLVLAFLSCPTSFNLPCFTMVSKTLSLLKPSHLSSVLVCSIPMALLYTLNAAG